MRTNNVCVNQLLAIAAVMSKGRLHDQFVVDSIKSLPWGKQPGCHGRVFVTNNSTTWSGDREITIWVDGIRVMSTDYETAWVYYPEEERLAKLKRKSHHRMSQKEYDDALNSVVEQLRSGIIPKYESGQEYGTFGRYGVERQVSARGAIARAFFQHLPTHVARVEAAMKILDGTEEEVVYKIRALCPIPMSDDEKVMHRHEKQDGQYLPGYVWA